MPIPIKPIMDRREDSSKNLLNDFSMFLSPMPVPEKKIVTASNKDASLLFEIWAQGEKADSGSIKISPALNLSSRDLTRLKTMGFITGNNDEVNLTKKGKIIVTTMALAEESQFEKRKTNKSYTEILASMDKRNKAGYRIPKFASDNTNRLNLKG